MDIRIGFNKIKLRSRIKACGGKWDTSKKIWQHPYEKAKELDLLDRIIDDESFKMALARLTIWTDEF